jgi:DNA-binding MarR family transcriptional regulator
MEPTVPPIVVEHNPSGGAGDVHDWLQPLMFQLIRSSGLLQPDQRVSGNAVSVSEGFALAELAGDAVLSQRDLAERLHLEKSTVSRLVAGLERHGLVARERNPENRRFYQLRLTRRGHAAAAALAATYRRWHTELLAAMTPAERDALAVGLAALVRALHAGRAAMHSGAAASGERADQRGDRRGGHDHHQDGGAQGDGHAGRRQAGEPGIDHQAAVPRQHGGGHQGRQHGRGEVLERAAEPRRQRPVAEDDRP